MIALPEEIDRSRSDHRIFVFDFKAHQFYMFIDEFHCLAEEDGRRFQYFESDDSNEEGAK